MRILKSPTPRRLVTFVRGCQLSGAKGVISHANELFVADSYYYIHWDICRNSGLTSFLYDIELLYIGDMQLEIVGAVKAIYEYPRFFDGIEFVNMPRTLQEYERSMAVKYDY